MFCYILGKAAVDGFFYSGFTVKLPFFFRFPTWKWLARQLRQSCHFSNTTISDWFEMFLISNSIIVISKVKHTWIIFPRSQRSLPTKPPVFERILTKAFCQYIIHLMSKTKLSSFNHLINAYFQSFICVCHDMNIFWPAPFVKFPWHCWTEFSQSWKDLRKTLQSHENLQSLTDLSGANIGIHSNSRDWLFWMFMMSKINPLMNNSMLFWKDV